MHCTSNSVLRHLIQRAYRMFNKSAQYAIQRAKRTSNIIILVFIIISICYICPFGFTTLFFISSH